MLEAVRMYQAAFVAACLLSEFLHEVSWFFPPFSVSSSLRVVATFAKPPRAAASSLSAAAECPGRTRVAWQHGILSVPIGVKVQSTPNDGRYIGPHRPVVPGALR